MKQAGYSKRPRGRSPERHRQPQRHLNGESGEGKLRGSPQQCVEKYLTLARDAASSGDPISAEHYYQYADHYYRLSIANRTSRIQSSERYLVEKTPLNTPSDQPSEKTACVNT
ncbi:MAG: DUF4167 domain-containing protein [Alphaproteobacteria bacterium]|nr:DUF4167 domain-containing protein [Alphaproteobacteria bacterium]